MGFQFPFAVVEVDIALHYKGTSNNKGDLWYWAFQAADNCLSEQRSNKKHIKIVLTQSFDTDCWTFLSCRDAVVPVLFRSVQIEMFLPVYLCWFFGNRILVCFHIKYLKLQKLKKKKITQNYCTKFKSTCFFDRSIYYRTQQQMNMLRSECFAWARKSYTTKLNWLRVQPWFLSWCVVFKKKKKEK